jgi:hypothetical protein
MCGRERGCLWGVDRSVWVSVSPGRWMTVVAAGRTYKFRTVLSSLSLSVLSQDPLCTALYRRRQQQDKGARKDDSRNPQKVGSVGDGDGHVDRTALFCLILTNIQTPPCSITYIPLSHLSCGHQINNKKKVPIRHDDPRLSAAVLLVTESACFFVFLLTSSWTILVINLRLNHASVTRDRIKDATHTAAVGVRGIVMRIWIGRRCVLCSLHRYLRVLHCNFVLALTPASHT